MQKERLVKVTVTMAESVWVKAKRRALADRTTLRALLLEGLELRLAKKGGKHGSR